MRISDCSSDVCSSDLAEQLAARSAAFHRAIATDRASAATAAARLGETVSALKAAFASRGFSGTDTFALVDAIAAKSEGAGFTDRSEESRVGKEWVSSCRSLWWSYYSKKKKTHY